ncbi:uncharacterized protein B0T15DRAFT_545221 [Chaetomium strumarium]|uniref:Uncharacterized protein n=1 Tax=Chaetomium strumarium TaxID=1170767 RepID=A0AAJ0H093_9PEZI|nr:hypothetical protein B0T15DRAFT_545221 [Chaetomium strumarium]
MSSSSRRDVRFAPEPRPSGRRLEVPPRDAYGRSHHAPPSSSSRSQPPPSSSMTLPIRSAGPPSSSSSSRHAPAADAAGAPPGIPPAPCTYTDDMLDYFEEENEEHVTQQHLINASDHVINTLKKAGIRYGILGGLGMVLLGNQGRTTRDADIAVEVKVKDLLAVFAHDKRVYVPRAQTVAGAGVARIFVLTGPEFGEKVRRLAVEVDLILNGERGTPRDLSGATETISVTTNQGRREWKVLKLKYFFKGKLRSFYNREGPNDYKDLCWMIFQHSDKVSRVAPDLDEDLRRNFADAYAERERNPSRVEYVEEVLGLRTPKNASGRDPGGSSSRSVDPRASDARRADPRYADPRYADPRYADSRYTDPRYADPRYADPRYMSSSSRSVDPRRVDPYASTKRR